MTNSKVYQEYLNKIGSARIIIGFLLLLNITTMISCSKPISKEKYLEKYKSFIEEINTDYKTFSEKQWTKAEEKYNKFNTEWYQKFENELSFKEKLTVYKYQYQFNSIKLKSGFEQMYDKHLKDDFTILTNKIKQYIEDTSEDSAKVEIEQLESYAEEVSDSIMIGILKNMLEELKTKPE